MKNKPRIILNIIIALAVPAAWIWMSVSVEGTLAATGVRSLRYFTVQSNFLAGAAAVAYLISALRHGGEASRGFRVFKYVAAVSVAVTFLTVVVLLVPIWGVLDLFSGPNLFFHLLIPLAAIVEFIIFKDERPGIKDNFLTVLPVFLYGCGYILNILINGMGGDTQKTTNDWYFFLKWGWGIGAVIFVCILSSAFLVGLFLRLTKKKKN